MNKSGSITVEGDYVVIKAPLEEVHGLRVAMAPCPCRAPKSNITQDIKARICRGLGRIPLVSKS